MFTSIDKALVALIMAVLSILSAFGVILPEWLSGPNITAVIAALTPLLVWLMPNKQ